jgi:cysteinyl-tRNA synthetase
MTSEEEAVYEKRIEFVDKFKAAMDDDFNTADASSAIFELVKFCNQNVNENSSRALAKGLYDQMDELCDVLGIVLAQEEESLDEQVEALIQERQQARKDKNFARADEIRDELTAMGIVLEDTREGVKWHRA